MRQKGFTIVEALVIIAIMAVFLAVVISNFLQIKLQFALSRTAYKFDQDLRRAQNLALSAVQYSGDKILAGYGIYIDLENLGPKKYIVYGDKITDPGSCNSNKTNCLPDSKICVGNERYNEGVDYIIKVIDFNSIEPGIIIKEISPVFLNNVSINFSSCDFLLRTKIIASGGQKIDFLDSVDIIFSFESDLNKIRMVSVNKAGLVKIE